MKDVIYSINGPVVTVKDTSTFGMAEMVYVGNAGLIGEVISVSEARTTIQVYENTTGLLVGEPVKGTGAPLSATLGPGIMENIFDGIERPLTDIAQKNGAFIATGVHVDSLDMARRWDVTVTVKPGDSVRAARSSQPARRPASSPTKAWCPRIFPASLPGPLKTANIP